MGSSNDGSPAAQSARQDDESDGTEQAPRGFFGRILDAFNPSDSQSGGQATDNAPGATTLGSGQLGLANLRKLRVDDVAIPKVEIAAVPLDIGKDDLVEAIAKRAGLQVAKLSGLEKAPKPVLVLIRDAFAVGE